MRNLKVLSGTGLRQRPGAMRHVMASGGGRAITAAFLTGFEYGILSVAPSGAGIFEQVPAGGSQTIVTDMNGKCLQIVVANGSNSCFIRTPDAVVAGAGIVTGHFNFKVQVAPDPLVNDQGIIATVNATAGKPFHIGYEQPTGQFRLEFEPDAAGVASGPVVAQGETCRVDFWVDLASNPRRGRAQINGVPITEITSAETGSTANMFWLGTNHGNESYTGRWDDLILSTTSANYPIGAAHIEAIRPNADGTHFPATPDCFYDAGPVLISGSNAAYQYLDDATFPTAASTADSVGQGTIHATHYVEVLFSDLIGARPLAVRGVMSQVSGGAAAVTRLATVAIRNDGTECEIYGTSGTPADYGTLGTSQMYRSKMIPAPGIGWTQAEVNALKARIGYSTDVTPPPRVTALLFEVAVRD